MWGIIFQRKLRKCEGTVVRDKEGVTMISSRVSLTRSLPFNRIFIFSARMGCRCSLSLSLFLSLTYAPLFHTYADTSSGEQDEAS